MTITNIACVSLSAAMLFCGCSARSGQDADVAAIVTNLFVSADVFLSIPENASFDTATNMLGNSKIRHSFTISKTNGVYTLISCHVDVGEGSLFCLLFHNGSFVKILIPPRREMEVVPWKGSTWSRIKSWAVEDTTYIEETIDTPAMARDQIKAGFDRMRSNNRTAGEPSNIMPAFLLTGYFEKMGPKMKKDYETNRELRKLYDGCRANVGMTPEQVDALYGKPLRVFSTKDGRPVRIYGDNRSLEVNHQYRYCSVAVVFDTQGRAVNIYGYGFVNEEWEKQ